VLHILDSISEGVLTIDLNKRITSFNQAAETITGWKSGDAIGQYCFDVFRANICEKRCAVDETLEGGVETFRDLTELERLKRELIRSYTHEDIVGRHPRMKEILSFLPDIAESESTVLIEGPTGTGAEEDRGPLLSANEQEEVEKIQAILDQYPRNRPEAAKALGMSRTTLWRKMKRYGLIEE